MNALDVLDTRALNSLFGEQTLTTTLLLVGITFLVEIKTLDPTMCLDKCFFSFVLLIYFYVFQMGTQVWYKFEDIVRRMNVREEEEEKKKKKRKSEE